MISYVIDGQYEIAAEKEKKNDEKEKTMIKELEEQKKIAKEAKESLSNLESEAQDKFVENYESGHNLRKRNKELEDKIVELTHKIGLAETHVTEIKWENKKFEQALAAVVLDNRSLQKELEEQNNFLKEAQVTIATLREHESASYLDSSLEMSREEDSEHSLLGELEREIQYRLAGRSEAKKPRDAAENCEEFFYLVCCSSYFLS